MRKYIVILYVLINFFMLNLAFGQNETDQIIVTNPQKTILVKQSAPTFSIILRSNPTTGFMWILRDYDNNLITPIRKIFYSSKTKLIGAGGYEKWTFRVNPKAFAVPQTTGVTLVYARPWNMEGAEVARYKVVSINDN